MNRSGIVLVLSLTATTLLASSLVGCQKQGNHAKWKSEADERWHALRSAAMLDMAEGQFKSGALDQAEKTVREAANIDPDHPGLHLLAGRIALEHSQLERAYHYFSVSAELDPNDPDSFYYQGIVLQRWQEHEKSLECYQKAYELDADDASLMLAVAETLVSLGRDQEAIDLLESKKLYFDQNAATRAMLGHLYVMRKDYDKAVDNFQNALTLDPENTRMMEELAMSQLAAGKNRPAARTLNKLLERSEFQDRADLWRSLATVEAKLGRTEKARQVYIDLTRANPDMASDWLRLGELCWKLKDTGGTLIAANRAINLDPQRHEGYLLAGLVWQERGRLDDALDMFDRASELAPSSSTPLILRGISLQKAGRMAAAADAYSQALERNPSDVRAERLLAQVSVDTDR